MTEILKAGVTTIDALPYQTAAGLNGGALARSFCSESYTFTFPQHAQFLRITAGQSVKIQ
ncbi:hypothetical protein [Leptolyngbya sp. KIOST-1]|uniref:hypothetical protein n=1 Tax=Leptolyngbya sp. KIOST-1 TaxID=1229172 RepID=UPI0005684DE2|nr:hypothetical protein [Leptolyngbya sp. KIOST-1]